MRLPDYLIIGAQKCGTTWLAAMLAQHPEVFAAQPKEIHYFDRAENRARGLAWYASHFEAAGPTQVVGEATPNYLGIGCEMPPEAAEALSERGHRVSLTPHVDAPHDLAREIHGLLPDARLIAILRDPVDRAVSAFHHMVRMRRVSPFKRILDVCGEHGILSAGFYHAHLTKWLELYPRDQLIVFVYEDDVLAGKQETLRRAYRHLGVRDDFVPGDSDRRYNERSSDAWMAMRYYAPSLARAIFRAAPVLHRLPWPDLAVTAEERETLRAAYQHERGLLEDLLGRTLDAW